MNNIRKMWRLIWAICRFRNNNDEAEQAHSARSLHCGVALRQCVKYGMRLHLGCDGLVMNSGRFLLTSS